MKFFLVALFAVRAVAAEPATIFVDATDARRGVFHSHLTVPAATLVYPKWIPGEHMPTGPLMQMAGLHVRANGNEIAWTRDRVDVFAFHIDVPAVPFGDLALPPPSESTATIAHRVAAARARQAGRYAMLPAERRIRTNAEAERSLLDETATPEPAGRALLLRAAERLRLSARGYHRVLRVARTLADLEGAETVGRRHVPEALSYRRLTVLPENAM